MKVSKNPATAGFFYGLGSVNKEQHREYKSALNE